MITFLPAIPHNMAICSTPACPPQPPPQSLSPVLAQFSDALNGRSP
ncbi:hypothetical protein GMORB2_2707 [Geosmithia morbida]|uniref:Uncharacterized protein n=1 Tax=Geosmithia morbida TaxID=1094350 RepID=A0A9P4YS39_9HYPO|nr:uncharacterized protein GMORB2_2707 [Geosmithia morbida]KAF4120703.1 hypothetical protein GMORB2_2707 [Geosmithia morbida]